MGDASETIFALASGGGRAGVAVVRISGRAADQAVAALTGRPPPPPRTAALRGIVRPRDGGDETIDQGLVLWFPGPHSFTGEDVAEFQLHGSPAVIRAVMAALAELPGFRTAEPGEFTRRAFRFGKLDLTAAEGLADLIDAQTQSQRRQALRQLQGGLAVLYQGWRTRLLRMTAFAETAIDFVDEAIPDDLLAKAAQEIGQLSQEIEAHLGRAEPAVRLREGLQVAIVGAPNVGKSSLLNALAGREMAIVSAHAGTTRDVIEVALELGGFAVVIADTAGLRDAGDAVERIGVGRAIARAREADIVIRMVDATNPDFTVFQELGLGTDDGIVVANKVDCLNRSGERAAALAALLGLGPGIELIETSVVDNSGIDDVIAALASRAEQLLAIGDGAAPTRERHRTALRGCLEALRRAETAPLPELVAEDLRLAATALGRVTGQVDVEDILDVIFREFCIGK